MAYQISDLDGTVNAPDSDYLYGSLKNVPNGTRANVKMFTDLWETVQKLMDASGIAPNGLPDNVTNGHQIHQSLQAAISQYLAPAIKALIPTYDATKLYVLTGAINRATDGTMFYNGEVFGFAGNSGAACGGGSVDIVTLDPTNLSGNLRILKAACGASGSGVTGNSNSNFANIVYDPFQVSMGGWVSPTVGAGWVRSDLQFRTNAKGEVFFKGAIVSTSTTPTQTIYTLPAGSRPTTDCVTACHMDVGGIHSVIYIHIASSGVVEVFYTAQVPATVGAIVYLTMPSILNS